MSPYRGTTEVEEYVTCPICRGVTGFTELHQPWGPGGPSFPIEHRCGFCASSGVVARVVVRSYWLARPPTA